MSKFIFATVVVFAATVYATAETYSGKFVAVKDGKITIRVLGKGDDLSRTYPLVETPEVRTGKFVRAKTTNLLTLEGPGLREYTQTRPRLTWAR